jgi:hypothetical protein
MNIHRLVCVLHSEWKKCFARITRLNSCCAVSFARNFGKYKLIRELMVGIFSLNDQWFLPGHVVSYLGM